MMLLAFALAAASHPTAYHHCLAHAGGVTADTADCQQAKLTQENARLNAIYQQTLARLPLNGRVQLRAGERQWIAHRDAVCREATASQAGGSAAGLAGQDCLVRETARRIVFLQEVRP